MTKDEFEIAQFLEKINGDFFSICQRTGMFFCPKELWPNIAKIKDGKLVAHIDFKYIEDDTHKYERLVSYLTQEIRSNKYKNCWKTIPEDERKWLVDHRNSIDHHDNPIALSNFDKRVANPSRLWNIIKIINNFYNYKPDFLSH